MIHRSASITHFWKSARRAGTAEAPRHGPSDARIASALRQLRDEGHRAVRILDLDCGNGERLMRAAALARELGFVAIEGRGASLSVRCIRHARREAASQAHPSTGLQFEIADPMALLASEHDGAADLVLLSDAMPYPASPLGVALARVCIGPLLGAE
ncbi:SAM-dependent methyltransferase [Sphingomonas sp. AOB5]|uniref:SAM-dependent methyltransferase n=1 Tax=Sphingomonas sp. AOB5 TaxID=3034017 RepID=UPI0023FA2B1E|nr:SAM-dependent methyltransferase [Sphingomonas sp. AOB5]MDF7775911.1 SAM-dependent methyltransferase [Sphingomonas sp. AOB5]